MDYIAAFEADEPHTVAWTLDRWEVLHRLRQLIANADILAQRHLNTCGPAAFLRVWLKRDPLAVARFACTLLRDGHSYIGALHIAPSWKLLSQDYSLMKAALAHKQPGQYHLLPERAEWMMMAALRDSENAWLDYTGDPSSYLESIAAITLPSTMAAWLLATGLYREVHNSTTVVPGVMPSADLYSFDPAPNRDKILFGVSSGLTNPHASIPSAKLAQPPAPLFLAPPNHFVVQLERFEVDPTQPSWTKVELWTWGERQVGYMGTALLASAYFGYVLAET